MYEEIPQAQLERIGKISGEKDGTEHLLKKDIKLIIDMVFHMSGKEELKTKEMEEWIQRVIVELCCEKFRRDGILMRTSKGWKETKAGKILRKSGKFT